MIKNKIKKIKQRIKYMDPEFKLGVLKGLEIGCAAFTLFSLANLYILKKENKELYNDIEKSLSRTQGVFLSIGVNGVLNTAKLSGDIDTTRYKELFAEIDTVINGEFGSNETMMDMYNEYSNTFRGDNA